MIKKLKKFQYSALNFTMAISFLLFNLLAYCVINLSQLSMLDNKIVIIVNSFARQHSLLIPVIITSLGDFLYFFLIFLITTFLLSFYKRYNDALMLTFVISSGSILLVLIKTLVHRLRPPIEYRLIDVGQTSFPSGHAFMSMCFYGTLIYFTFKYVKNKRIMYLLTATLTMIILLIGFSRLYLGVHYPSDILASFCLGIFWIGFWIKLFSFIKNTNISIPKNSSTLGD